MTLMTAVALMTLMPLNDANMTLMILNDANDSGEANDDSFQTMTGFPVERLQHHGARLQCRHTYSVLTVYV